MQMSIPPPRPQWGRGRRPDLPEGSPSHPAAQTLLTCMMSMAMAWVCTPSTTFTSQWTTSALMKACGESPFCSESSWMPVLQPER